MEDDRQHTPWDKGKLIGQKPPLKLKEIWAIRVRPQVNKRTRDLALFNLAMDSKLRGCDLLNRRVRDVAHGIQFEITEQTSDSVSSWISNAQLKPDQYLFPSRIGTSPHLSTWQSARIVQRWISSIGLDASA